MGNDVQYGYLLSCKYKNPEDYRNWLKKWNISEEEVNKYEEDNEQNKAQSEISNTTGVKSTLSEKELQWVRNFRKKMDGTTKVETAKKAIALLIDGDNNTPGLIDLKDNKNKFKDVFCWTNNKGNKTNLERQYGIQVRLVDSKPQEVDKKIYAKLEDMNFIKQYDKIFVVSIDKGYDKYANKQIIIEQNIKSVLYDIEHNR